MSLQVNELFRFPGAPGAGKKGGPKNEGISRDMYENKGPEIWFLECLEMSMKTNHLWVRLEMLMKTKEE